MIGDSMDNPLVPFMGIHFNEVHSFDLRSYNEDIIKSIEDINPDIIMCIGLSTSIIDAQESEIFKWNLGQIYYKERKFMKKILFVMPNLGGGGAEKVLIDILKNIDKKSLI